MYHVGRRSVFKSRRQTVRVSITLGSPMWFLLWFWLVCNSRHTIHTRKHHFSRPHCILPAACLLHSLCVTLTDWNFPLATSLANLSVFIRRWRVGNKLSWLRGWGSPRCPPQIIYTQKDILRIQPYNNIPFNLISIYEAVNADNSWAT